MEANIHVIYLDQWTIVGILFLILLTAMLVYDIYLAIKKHRELVRLKKLNDVLNKILDRPFKEAKRILNAKKNSEE